MKFVQNCMNGEMAKQIVTVMDPQGLHMRPAAAFAKVARQFSSAVTVSLDDRRVNGKSQLDLMLLAAEPGAQLLVEADGNDAKEALAALGSIFDVTDWDAEETAAALPKNH
jgi:phosphocarrier protein HPr